MKKMNISKNIADLRKKKNITQEQLAQALCISPQAISKWETDTSLPDTQMLPLIADYFEVSIDYLFYGQDISYNDIYEKVFRKIAKYDQMSKEAYEDALTVFAYAHHGTSRWKILNNKIHDEPLHISNQNGISLLSGKGYGAILTRDFFENISSDTAEFALTLFPALSEKRRLIICMAIISMSDISFDELKEKLGYPNNELREALELLIDAKIVIEKQSKHKSLGYTYEINSMYHSCLCILLATVEMQRYSLKGISCNMGYGDYPIDL